MALAVGGLLFAGAAGCGGEGDGGGQDDKKPSGKGGATASAAGPKALTEAQLTAASFTDGETVGKYTASEYTLGAPHGDDYTAEPAVCQPLVSLAADVTDYDLKSEVNRQVDVPDEMLGLTVAVQLRSYGGGDAARVMKALDKAGKECADGFTEVRAVAKGKYLKVEPVKAPEFGAGADEAKAYHFTILDVKGKIELQRVPHRRTLRLGHPLLPRRDHRHQGLRRRARGGHRRPVGEVPGGGGPQVTRIDGTRCPPLEPLRQQWGS
ncbi:hypothetical protein [Streptomyces flavidovirens]|uniref:hypothetical protein n=1 Tax=Streptomyces flavidovirens TaxID=67298 RepID=UPI00048AD2B8|nr:hypothetical protein [Streptomyces flavidovirens]